MALPRRPLPARPGAVPAGLGHRRRRHDPGRPARRRRAACSRSSRPGDGEVAGVSPIRRQVPVERLPAAADPLRAPVRPAHARRGDRADPGHRGPQHPPVRPAPGQDGRSAIMTSHASGPPPFAITLDVGSSRANKTGSWRTERPVYADRLPPCNNACPAGENIQQWLYHAEEGGYEAAWRQIMADNPFPAVMGRVCYRPVRDRLQPGPARRRRSASTRSSGSSATRPSRQGWTAPGPAPPTGRAGAGGRRRPAGPVRGVPPGPGSATRSRSGTPRRRPAA